MKLTFEEQNVLMDELAEKFEEFEYKRKKVELEVKRRVREEFAEEAAQFAKVMHEAHELGLTKDRIRVAVRKAGNNIGFNELWFAAPVDNAVDLRRGVKAVNKELKKWVWVEDDLVVTLEDGTEHTLLSVALEDGEFTVFSNSNDYYGKPEYTELILAAQEALRERSN